MQQESENLQQKNISFGEQHFNRVQTNDRRSIQQNQYVNDNAMSNDQYRYTNQTNKNPELPPESQISQSNYNFAALRSTQQSNPMDLKKLQEFMDLNHTGGQKSINGSGSRMSNTSFAEEVQKEIQEFSAGKQMLRRNRTGSNQSRNSNAENNQIYRQSDNNFVEYPKKEYRGSEVKVVQRRSDDQFSDDKLSFFLKNCRDDEQSASSLSKRNRDIQHDSFMVNQNPLYYPPFIDDKLSNINDTIQSNLKNGGNPPQQPKITNQAMNAIASVFDNIDILNPNKEQIIQQMNDSQINSKFLVEDNNDFSEQKQSPARESYNQPYDDLQNLLQKDKQKEQVVLTQLNDETGSFAKDGYLNFGERNSIRDGHYNDFILANTRQQINIENEKSNADQFDYNQYQSYQRQTFNPNDQPEITHQPQKAQPNIDQQQNQEIQPKCDNSSAQRQEQKPQDLNSLTREERDKQLELMMDHLMAQRQNFFKNKQANSQLPEVQTQQQVSIDQSGQHLQHLQKQEQQIIVDNSEQSNQFQISHPFQDQFKQWQAQKYQNLTPQQVQAPSEQLAQQRSPILEQQLINQELSQKWESLASQTKIAPQQTILQFNPVQEFNIQQQVQPQVKQQFEQAPKTEIKAIKVDLGTNDLIRGTQENIQKQIQSSVNEIYQSQKQIPQLHSQQQNPKIQYSQNNKEQWLLNSQPSSKDQTLNQSEFGASRTRIEQQKNQSRSSSRMSQAGRNQKFADGRQSRSGSKSSVVNQDEQPSFASSNVSIVNNAIPSISNTKTVLQGNHFQQFSGSQNQTFTQNDPLQRPVAGSNRDKMIQQNNQQINQNYFIQPPNCIPQLPQSNVNSFRSQPSDQLLDQTMELKRKQMAQDQAKAMQSQKDLEMNAKKRRQEEQQKLLDDLKNFYPSQKVTAEANFRQQIMSPPKKKEIRKISANKYHDDEFNDIDESTENCEASSTIRASGPQNHRRYDQYQGPLYQRNKKPNQDPTPNILVDPRIKNQQYKPAMEIQRNPSSQLQYKQSQHIENSQSEFSQMPFGTVITTSQQRSNDQNSITLLNNVDTSLLTENKTQVMKGIANQQYNLTSNFQRDLSKNNILSVEKENQVKRAENNSEFNRLVPLSTQNYKASDQLLQSSERRDSGSATKFFQALSKKRSESRGNTQNSSGRNSRSGALKEVINRSNSRGDRFRFFGKKENDSKIQDNPNNLELLNSQLGSAPTIKQIKFQSNQQFLQEFKYIIQKNTKTGQNRNPNIYLTDIMKELGFLHQNIQIQNQRENRLIIMLDQQRENLNLISNSGSQSKYLNEIIDNFFTICCSILGLQIDSKQVFKMDQSVLDSVLNQIDMEKDDQDILILEQLVMIKILINRPSYSLNDNQQLQIQSKFQNLVKNRNNYLQNKTQSSTQNALSPRIFNGSKQNNVQEQPIVSNLQGLHSQTGRQQNSQHPQPWTANRPNSGVRQNSNPRGQQQIYNYHPMQQPYNQDALQNNNERSNSSTTLPQQQQVKVAINQQRSPFRQQNEMTAQKSFNQFHQQQQYKFQNSPAKIVKFNKVQPVSGSQNCPSEQITVRDSFNSVEQTVDSYIGARETQRVADFSSLSTSLKQNNNTNNQKPSINAYGHQFQNKSPLRDNKFPIQKQQLQTNQQSEANNQIMQRQVQQQTNLIPNNKQQSTQNKYPSTLNELTSTINSQGVSHVNMMNDSFGPIYHTQTVTNEQNEAIKYQQNRDKKSSRHKQPICVLKIELDGSHVEEIQIFQGEDPDYVVKRFADTFNLSDDAVIKLSDQIRQQIFIFQKSNRNKI